MKKLFLIVLFSLYTFASNAEETGAKNLPLMPGPVMTARTHVPGSEMAPSGPMEPATPQNVNTAMQSWKRLYDPETRETVKNFLKDYQDKIVALVPEETQAKFKATIDDWKEKLQRSPEKLDEFVNSVREYFPHEIPDNLREKARDLEHYFSENYGAFRDKMWNLHYNKNEPQELETGTGIK